MSFKAVAVMCFFRHYCLALFPPQFSSSSCPSASLERLHGRFCQMSAGAAAEAAATPAATPAEIAAKKELAATRKAARSEVIFEDWSERLRELVAEDRFDQELVEAFQFCRTKLPTDSLCVAAAKRTADEVKCLLETSNGGKVTVGGALGMLDLPRQALEGVLMYPKVEYVFKERFARKCLPESLADVLEPTMRINASVWDSQHFLNLVRSSGDAEVAVACLIIYWARDMPHSLHWLLQATRDLVFSFQAAGVGFSYQLRQFGGIESEEREKKVLGMSARGKCFILFSVGEAMQQETGKSDAKSIIAHCKASKIDLPGWSDATVARYMEVGRKIHSNVKVKLWLTKSEYFNGEEGAFYGITALRALASRIPKGL